MVTDHSPGADNKSPSTDLLGKAARNSDTAQEFLKPVISDYANELKACIERIRAHQEAGEIREFAAPNRTIPMKKRAADLTALPNVEPGQTLSLDIFDTCLNRLLESPYDIFLLLGAFVEKQTGMEAETFAEKRQETERRLRKAGLADGTAEDTSFKAIYTDLTCALGWGDSVSSAVQGFELYLEGHFLVPDPEVKSYAWKVVERGLPLVYTSEMYLPSDTLRKLLLDAGFPVEGIAIRSSGELGLSKGTGNLYRDVTENVEPGCLVHVGDNPVSDVEVPLSLGIHACHIQTSKSVYPDLMSNVLSKVSSSGSGNTNEHWEDFGFKVAGPIHFGYAVNLYKTCRDNGIDDLFFLSRDGWFPRKVFQRLQESWGAVAADHYLYSSREYWGIGAMDEIGPDDWDFILKPSPLLTTADFFKRLGIDEKTYREIITKHNLPAAGERLCHHWGFKDPLMRDRLYGAVCDCLPAFLKFRASIQENLRGYLETTGIFNAKTAISDVGWSGSSWKSLKRMTEPGKKAPMGFYFALMQTPDPSATAYFSTGEQRASLLKGSIALIEFLFGSPEPTAQCMDAATNYKDPVFRKPWAPYELAAWEGIEKGIHRYVESALELLPRPSKGDGIAFLETKLHDWLFEPSKEDLKMLGALTHAEGWGTDNRLRILPKLKATEPHERLLEAMCYAPWKPGLQAQLQEDSSCEQR